MITLNVRKKHQYAHWGIYIYNVETWFEDSFGLETWLMNDLDG